MTSTAAPAVRYVKIILLEISRFSVSNYSRRPGVGSRCVRHLSKLGTGFSKSRLPLQKWFLAVWLYSEHRKGISSVQLARDIGVTQKTAWHMLGRLREASSNMTTGLLSGTVEADETY